MRPLYNSCGLESTRATRDTYSDTTRTIMLATVLTPRQLARQVGGSIKCDSSSMVVGATCLVARASSTTLDSGVHFPGKSIIAGAFTLNLAFNIGNLGYVTDYYDKLCPLNGTMPAGNELPALPPPAGLLGVDLKVLAQQI